MKKIVTALLIFSPIAGAAGVAAEPAHQAINFDRSEDISGLHTFTLGYAQSHINHFKSMRGVNLKYRYEIPELPLSAMVSFTAMSTRGNDTQQERDSFEVKHRRVRYYSLMVGPAWRATDWASLYLLGGAGWEKSWNQNQFHSEQGEQTGRYKIFDARFAWGTGIQFNLIDHLAIDVGYQGGHVQKTSSNGFNIGVGYRF